MSKRARTGRLDRSAVVSAQVLLHGRAGNPLAAREGITSQTIAAYTPDAEAAKEVQRAFRALGFQVEPMVGNSFAVTGDVALFERTFGSALKRSRRGGVQATSPGGSTREELPLGRLADPIRRHVAAVTFTPPPDFGPTNFGP